MRFHCNLNPGHAHQARTWNEQLYGLGLLIIYKQHSGNVGYVDLELQILKRLQVYLYPKISFWYVKETQFRSPLHQHLKKKVHQVMK